MGILKKSANVLFSTFSPYVNNKRDPKNGNIDPMISFFIPKINKFVLIDQPHAGSDIVAPVIEEYLRGMANRKYNLNFFLYKPLFWIIKSLNLTDDDTSIFLKIRDFISVLHIGLKSKEKFDFFIGLESINALAGLLLKKIGKVKKVIYYTSDYSPTRYSNKLFNKIYINLDKLCCSKSDYLWDVSRAMFEARLGAGLNKEKSAPVIHVPNALFPQFIKHLPQNKLKPFSLVFMGSLGFENGPDIAIKALPNVIKNFPNAKLNIIGGKEADLARLKKLTKSLELEKYIKFYGMIAKDEDMLFVLRKFYLALAPYLKLRSSVRWYGDSLKLRAYMACGLPVITTEVPPLGRELKSYGSAIVTGDNENDLAKSIIKILSNAKLYKNYRAKAIEYGKNNTWENTFANAFRQMEVYEQN